MPMAPGVLLVPPGLNWKRFPGNRGSPRRQGSQGFLKSGKSEREKRRPPQPTTEAEHAEVDHALGIVWPHQDSLPSQACEQNKAGALQQTTFCAHRELVA
ncbi:hypothetical protein NDU88_006387 [Pleurodeles waltl]|uniref:Uncharacterized protein n=1 Tax=Pleurodeles waltl TaxID=8319 RepID=A0AAV7TX00_PLEWA|nr:hypothetical protein NDU88_006387 [Pleurodeles waltl]